MRDGTFRLDDEEEFETRFAVHLTVPRQTNRQLDAVINTSSWAQACHLPNYLSPPELGASLSPRKVGKGKLMYRVRAWFREEDHTFQAVASFDLHPNKTALLVIDMQNVQTHRDYGHAAIWREHYPAIFSHYYPWIEQIVVPAQQRLLQTFRGLSLRVIYLRVGALTRDGSDVSPLWQPRDLGTQEGGGPRHWRMWPPGTKEYEIREDIAPVEDELVINKNTSSGFTASPLDQVLRNLGIEYLILTGTATCGCVLATALDAADRGYKCTIAEDACAVPQPDFELHDATLRIFHKIYGRVETAEAVCAELQLASRSCQPNTVVVA